MLDRLEVFIPKFHICKHICPSVCLNIVLPKLNCLNRKWEPNDDVGSVCPRVWTLWLQRDECFVNNLHVRDKKNLFDVMARALLHLKSQHCCRSFGALLLFWHRLFWRGGVVALAFIFRGSDLWGVSIFKMASLYTICVQKEKSHYIGNIYDRIMQGLVVPV